MALIFFQTLNHLLYRQILRSFLANFGAQFQPFCPLAKHVYSGTTFLIGLINGLIEIKVFTMKIQWFTNEERSGAGGLVQVSD